MVRMTPEETRRMKLAALTEEHRQLNAHVDKLSNDPMVSALEIQRLKKRKLALRDAIVALQDQLTPDIIA